ncbi:MAG: hypothetical protein ACJAVI_001298 [Candidatus Azotimanducaceae bacterium]|jgi:hypothetical protein
MKRIAQTLALVSMTALLSSCVVSIGNDDFDDEHEQWQGQQDRALKMINGLDLGRDLASIESEFGVPDFTDSFMRSGEAIRILHYRTHHSHSDGKTTRDETTPLVFIDDQLVGWGDMAIEKATR